MMMIQMLMSPTRLLFCIQYKNILYPVQKYLYNFRQNVCSTDVSRLHPKSGGQRWSEVVMECVAQLQAGGHEDGCASGLPLHTSEGEAGPASHPV